MADLPFDGSAWCNIDIALRKLDQVFSKAIEELDLKVIEAYILWSLNDQDGQRASDLACAVGRVATSFTPILDGLERRALVERRLNPSDRRSVHIYLTPDGDRVSRQASALLQAADAALQEHIGSEQLSSFLRVVLMLQNLRSAGAADT